MGTVSLRTGKVKYFVTLQYKLKTLSKPEDQIIELIFIRNKQKSFGKKSMVCKTIELEIEGDLLFLASRWIWIKRQKMILRKKEIGIS